MIPSRRMVMNEAARLSPSFLNKGIHRDGVLSLGIVKNTEQTRQYLLVLWRR